MLVPRRSFCLAATGALLVACGGAASSPTAAPTPTPAPAPPTSAPAAPPAAATPQTVTLSQLSATATAAARTAPGATAAPTAAPRAATLKVVTTVAPITNIVRNVGGDKIDLTGIVPEGADSHTFEPAPSDAAILGEADLVIVNGLHLEEPTLKLAEANKKPGRELLLLGDNTVTKADWVFDFSFPQDQGDPNPHLWMNVAYAMKYAELSRDALIKLDPANKAAYEKNAATYLALLDTLDKGIMAAVKTVPEQNRRLLTYHDSWPYFAKRYGMTVIGAIQPADFAEPSAKEVADIVDQIKKEQVPAIFGSEVFPSKVLEQIGRETSVKYIDTLRDDDMPGDKTAPEHTYVGMVLENMQTMLTALGGNVYALKGIDPKNVA
jgi:ABC-type Zn uptake system ZnuABC Zn-binding protein ZnuA